MNQDFVDLLRAFIDHDVRFLIVGAYPLGVHGKPRATGDLDIWVEPDGDNATRVMKALAAFGAPTVDVTAADFSQPGIVFQIGLPPRRINILTDVTGLTFPSAWPSRVEAPFGPVTAPVLGRNDFIKNKRATGRAKDLGDLESLGE